MTIPAVTNSQYTQTTDGPIQHIKFRGVVYPVAIDFDSGRDRRMLTQPPERNDFGELLYATPDGGRITCRMLTNR